MVWPYINILVLQVYYSGNSYYNPHSTVESIWSEHFSRHKMAKFGRAAFDEEVETREYGWSIFKINRK